MLGPGTRLGVYEIVSVLGVGGMGEVYRARDTRLQREVAVKVLPEAFATDAERLARFEREAQLLASLNHPHIAAIYGVEESGNTRALILELVEGPTLADRIAQGAVPIDEALPIAKQVADALEAAHEQGIIHRDLKPANVKLRPDGTVKVLDFGLAKLTQASGSGPRGQEAGGLAALSQSPTITSPAMTNVGVILGTAAYMAPEQAKGRPADRRSDVWAFGCVLYEMLTGQRAFEGDDVSETLAFVLSRDVNWAALPAGTPSAIRRLLRRALEKNRSRRLSDIADARLELEEALSTPEPQPIVAPTARPLWKRALPAVAAVVVTAALVGYSAWRLRPEAPRPVTRYTVTLPAGENFSNMGGHVLALSPDGAHLVYAANLRLYLRARDQLEATPIRGTEGGAAGSGRRPFFSPDGQWIGFWQDGQIKKVSVTGGAPVTLGAAVAPFGASWGSDDTIVFGGGPSGIWRVPGGGGPAENIVKVDEGFQAQGPQMLPDGKTLLFTLAKGLSWDHAQIVVQSLETGARQVLVNGGTDGRYVSTGHLVYVLDGAILAVPFALDTLTVTGGPVPLVEDVAAATTPGGAGAGQFSFTSDGILAYVPSNIAVAGAQRTLVWVDRQGREEPIPAPPGGYVYPRVSPDGTRLALDTQGANRDIWVWDFSRGTMTRLTFDPTADRVPIWTPDGRRLIFSSDRAGPANLFWQAADGTGEAERLTESPNAQFATAVSPDGSRVIVREDTTASLDLMVLTLAGTRKVQPLLTSMFVELSGDVSPDGRWLAYESNASGREEIYVRPFPDVGGGQWQISTMGGSEPLWARDGRELFYRAADGAVMRVPIEDNTTWKAGIPTRLVQAGYYDGDNNNILQRTYDVSPDGRRFLMIKNDAAPAVPAQTARIIVVENWFEELQRRVPTQ